MTESNGRSDELKLAIQPKKMERQVSHKEQQQLAARPLRAESPLDGDDYLGLKKRRKRRRQRCCACCVVTLMVVAIIILVLALTVFKTKDPKMNVKSVTLEGLSYGIDQATLKLHLNVTVVSEMSIKNPNKAASFKFGDSTAFISYRGSAVGQALIPAGKIKADKTADMKVRVTIFTDVLLSNSNLLPDGISGSVPISASTKLAGKVDLLHIIKKHVTIYSVCDVVISLSSKSADVQRCSRSVKI
jgi:hypothetical protein